MSHPVEVFHTATGRWWLPVDLESDIVINAIKDGAVFGWEIVQEAERHIRRGTTVLDIGSNVGQMAVVFSRLVGPRGRVHAFEADPFLFGLLRRNIEENGCRNVTLHAGAVWHTSGRALPYPEPDLQRFRSLGSYGIDPRARSGRTVMSATIDSLNIARRISFMKVDVQGSDLFALIGARHTICRHRMPIVFEYEEPLQKQFGTEWSDYEKFVRSMGYRIVKTIADTNHVIVPDDRRSIDGRTLAARIRSVFVPQPRD